MSKGLFERATEANDAASGMLKRVDKVVKGTTKTTDQTIKRVVKRANRRARDTFEGK